MSALDITAFPNQPNDNSMNDSVQQRVFKTIAEVLNRKENEIRLDASIRDDLQASSLEQMTIFVALEDEFQRNMPPEEVTGLTTVKDIIDFIDRKLQETSPA
jgi:acyl carrier protein